MHKLDEILEAAEPGAVMVARPVLDRLLLIAWKQPPLVGQVPHRDFVVMDRQVLVNRVDSTELLIPSDRNLPREVLVLERPGEEELAILRKNDPFGPAIVRSTRDLNTFDSDEHEVRRRQRVVLVEVWKRLFLAMVDRTLLQWETDLALAQAPLDGATQGLPTQLGLPKPTLESGAKPLPSGPMAKFASLLPEGTIEYEEITRVLHRERCVLPDSPRAVILREFALLFLGLRCFSPQAVGYWFPALSASRQDELFAALDGEIPVAKLLSQSRPAPWLEAASDSDDLQSEANQYFIRLQRLADQSLEKDRLVNAAILRVMASRVAPAHKTEPARKMARAHLRQLVLAIHQRLGLREDQVDEATAVLDPLLEKADQGHKNREEKLLNELENIHDDVVSPPQVLDIMGWVLSGGVSRLRRPMVLVDVIRATRFLRMAQQHLTFTRIDNSARQSVESLLRTARLSNENEVRAQIGPALSQALGDAGFSPTSHLGKLALGQIVETLIDRILEQGFLTFQNLRDTLAVSPVKMPDLADFAQWVRGDALLLLDRRLSTLLEGIYQPSELYGATLERATAAFFGTQTGRFVSLFVLFPYLTAFVVVAFIYHLLKTLEHNNLGPATPDRDISELIILAAAFGTALLVFVARPRVRLLTRHILGRTFDVLSWTFWEMPRKLSSSELVRNVVLEPLSWVLGYGVKPLFACWLMRQVQPLWFQEAAGWIIWFALFNIILNTRPGLLAGALVARSTRRLIANLGNGLISGAVLIWQNILRRMITGIDTLILGVEGLIAVRQRDERVWTTVQALLQTLWFPVGYALRFMFMVVIEPFLNPVKLPVSFVAMKIFYPVIGPPLHLALDTTFNFFIVEAFVWVLDFIIPGAFGFFFWEFRENWRLYEANRPARMPAAMFGPHAETMRDLLEPGFHAGTLPAVYRKLRKACDLRSAANDLRQERACLREIGEIGEDLAQLARRQFFDVLGLCAAWRDLMARDAEKAKLAGSQEAGNQTRTPNTPPETHPTGFSVRNPILATNRIEMILDWNHPRLNPEESPLTIDIEFMAGNLFARVGRPPWLGRIPAEATRSLTASLAWFFTQSGIGVSIQHLEAGLPGGFVRATFEPRAITLFPPEHAAAAQTDPRSEKTTPLRLRMDWSGERLIPVRRDSRISGSIPAPTMIFGSVPVSWSNFVGWFDDEAKTPSRDPLFVGPFALHLLPEHRQKLVLVTGEPDPAQAS